jgi:hypothetical protein
LTKTPIGTSSAGGGSVVPGSHFGSTEAVASAERASSDVTAQTRWVLVGIPVTVKARSKSPGSNVVGWPRPSGAGKKRFASPMAIWAASVPSLEYPKVAEYVDPWFVTHETKTPIRGPGGIGLPEQCVGNASLAVATLSRSA